MTSDGINPREEKIADIQDTRACEDVSEVRSLMVLVQYSSKFMPDAASVAGLILTLADGKVLRMYEGGQQFAIFARFDCPRD